MDKCIKYVKETPLEPLAFTFVMVLSILVYSYGVFYILPPLMEDLHPGIHVLAFLLATWCLIGVYGHMYFIRRRNSSIKNRFFVPVVQSEPEEVTEPPGDLEDNSEGEARTLNRRIKYLGEQFTASPFGSKTAWHICSICESYVPPRTWHCSVCKTCILKRDHHCVFAMTCIGEDNQVHFLGFLLYLSLGTAYASVMSMIYNSYFLDISWWLYLLRGLFAVYIMFFDFSVLNLLSCVSLAGGITALGMFTFYLRYALRGQTSADVSRKVTRIRPGEPTYSYENFKSFLGPNPIIRILVPFLPGHSVNYDSTAQSKVEATKSL